MLAVIFVLAATLTLLPAVLAKLGPKVDKLALPWAHSGEHRSPRFAAWAERLWRRPVAYGAVGSRIARRARVAGHAAEDRRCRRSRSSPPRTPRASATTRSRPRSAPARPVRCRSSRARPTPTPSHGSRRRDGGIAAVLPAQSAVGARARHGDPQPRSLRSGGRPDDRPAASPAAGGRVRRRRGCREPRPRDCAVGQGAARHRRRARARLPAAADRAAGAAGRSSRRGDEPARNRRRLRRREVDLPGRGAASRCSASSRRASSTPGGPCSSSR